MFSKDAEAGLYDGLQITTKVDAARQTSKFTHADVSAKSRPDLFARVSNFSHDSQNDWVLLPAESSVTCEDVGHCEFSVTFVRNLDTLDEEHDIAITEGEELQYALTGFYQATDSEEGHVTHQGQSQDLYILMGALSYTTTSSLLVATAIFAYALF